MEENKKPAEKQTIKQIISGQGTQKKKIIIKKRPIQTNPVQNRPDDTKSLKQDSTNVQSQSSEQKQNSSQNVPNRSIESEKKLNVNPVASVNPIKNRNTDQRQIIIQKDYDKKIPNRETEKKDNPLPDKKPTHTGQFQQQHQSTHSHQAKQTHSVTQHSHTKPNQPPLVHPLKQQDRNPIISKLKKPTQPQHGPNQGHGTGYGTQGGQNRGGYRPNDNRRPNDRPQGQGYQGQGGYGQGQGQGQSYGQGQRPFQKPGQGGGFQNKKNPKEGFTGETGFTEIPRDSVPVQNRKKTPPSTFDKSRDKNSVEENVKFFKTYKKQNISLTGTTIPKEISIMENIQVGELAKKLNLKPNDVIAKLMKMGMMVTINNVIDSDTASILCDEYGCKTRIVSLFEETVIQEEVEYKEDNTTRPPVVTIMGHVDHGKTKLLDAIRKTSVIDTESGGITQHIGAYQVATSHGKITFLDTPGHEAFTTMRARGAKVTDIVVLVVAAEDGVKKQTLEAISHARAANVPIIVAINKIDLPTANLDKVMQELANQGLQPEEWGGSTITCKISAKQNIGLDKLLDMILLQSEVLELNANPKRLAKGTVIEAKLDPGRGSVATVLIQNGTLRVGDPFLAGVHSGRVRAMFDDWGHSIKEAPPSFPVLVTGLDGLPEAGDPFDAIRDEKEARNISQHRKEYLRIGQAANIVRVTLANMNEFILQGSLKELKIIIKADVRGSAEAIKESLEKLSNENVKLNVILAGTGAIIDSDVMLASASNAMIVGFQVRANTRTLALAEKEKVEIKYYSIIYNIVNEIKAAMEGLLEPEKVEEVIGQVSVREIFKIAKQVVAGCMVTSGKITRSSNVRIIRDEVVLFDGKIKSLKRLKDDASEVLTGFECGILIDGFNELLVGDEIEVYDIKIVAQKL